MTLTLNKARDEEYEQHPPGRFKARVIRAEEFEDGPYGPSIRITYRTEHKRGSGYFELPDFVSNKDDMFRPSKTKLVNRLTGILGVQTFDELPDQLELTDLEGKLVTLNVIHNEAGRHKVDTVVPYEQPAKEPLLAKQPVMEPVMEPVIEDGFDDNLPF